eukprot:TRINITY_DN526_c1_g1_i4.p2 TRINITY_DN526_c1_g1~~TRINITY_DN526_c1_g1_i4.p2  ORF type:complete len:191 (-),score=43.49 TRINITY_DN526_c1_g1_i4:1209-1781(-)
MFLPPTTPCAPSVWSVTEDQTTKPVFPDEFSFVGIPVDTADYTYQFFVDSKNKKYRQDIRYSSGVVQQLFEFSEDAYEPAQCFSTEVIHDGSISPPACISEIYEFLCSSWVPTMVKFMWTATVAGTKSNAWLGSDDKLYYWDADNKFPLFTDKWNVFIAEFNTTLTKQDFETPSQCLNNPTPPPRMPPVE